MHRPAQFVGTAAIATLLSIGCAQVKAQCSASWQQLPVSAPLPFGALVNELHVWDPDGAGPLAAGIVFAGAFSVAGTTAASNIAWYEPVTGTWTALGVSISYEVDALTTDALGRLVAGGGGGAFPLTAGFVDVWTGSNWMPLATSNGYVWTLLTMPNGDIIAGGDFTMIGGVAAAKIARFDGVAWHAMGGGSGATVRDLELDAAGQLFAVGDMITAGGVPVVGGVGRWDGTNWQSLPTTTSALPLGAVDIAFDVDGDLWALGVFFDGGNLRRLARYGTSGWETVPGGPSGPAIALAAHPNGDLVVGGYFTTASGTPANNVARWDGANWQALGGGLGAGINHQVLTLTPLRDGSIVAGGFFDNTGAVPPASNLAIYSGTCLPTVQDIAIGCTGPGGALGLGVTDLAWIGGKAKALSGVFSPGSVAISVWGFGTLSLPLTNVFPFAQPGCSLWVTPDVLLLAPVAGPAIATEASIPGNPVLIGAELFHQVLALQFGVGGVPTHMTSSNAVRFVVGDL